MASPEPLRAKSNPLIAIAPQGCAGDLETDSNGSVMIVPFADNIGAVERVNVSEGVQGTAISTLVELVFWLPNELGPLLLKLGCSCFYVSLRFRPKPGFH
jgi:hypothetical protein